MAHYLSWDAVYAHVYRGHLAARGIYVLSDKIRKLIARFVYKLGSQGYKIARASTCGIIAYNPFAERTTTCFRFTCYAVHCYIAHHVTYRRRCEELPTVRLYAFCEVHEHIAKRVAPSVFIYTSQVFKLQTRKSIEKHIVLVYTARYRSWRSKTVDAVVKEVTENDQYIIDYTAADF